MEKEIAYYVCANTLKGIVGLTGAIDHVMCDA